jgi:CelD/BcsL family acetyltransferase involved in cellulose biosynthesis
MQGIKNAFAEPGVEAFVRDLCLKGIDEGKPLIEIHALDCDDGMIAMFACMNDGEQLSSMFNSYVMSAATRFSPGLVLLGFMIRNCIERRIGSFDLGVGEAEYKSYFCDETQTLFDSFLGLSPRGQVSMAALSARAAFKRRIKRSPALLKFALEHRRLTAAKPPSGVEPP